MSFLPRLATADSLLIVTDFDGTLAGLSTDIYDVPVDADSLAALTRLAGLPDTHVAVLSGRHLDGLRQVCHLQPPAMTCILVEADLPAAKSVLKTNNH